MYWHDVTVVWCQTTLLQYLRLLRHTVQANISSYWHVRRAYILQQTVTKDTTVVAAVKNFYIDARVINRGRYHITNCDILYDM